MQWSILAPLVILLIVGAVEAALVLQARACVSQAALAGAEAAAVERGSLSAAQQAAVNVATVGGLDRVQVDAGDSAERVHVSVVAHVHLPIDLGFGAVRASADLPREH